jgi:Ca2+-binding EF-hand superfamily protein
MKAFSILIATGSLLCAVPLAQACDVKHHGECPDSYFKQMDKNGDGTISKKEFDAFHSEHFKALDANHDGKISPEEMQAGHSEMESGQKEMESGHKMREKSERDPFDKRFEESDINHDGALSRDECEIGMPMLFGHFDEFDANKDGKITKAEVVESMKKMQDKHMDKDGMKPAQK